MESKLATKSNRTDRRVTRTRQLLRDALASVVLEKGYEAATVQDILEKANIGRSTFYAHYSDKHELLVSGFDHLRQTFEALESQEHRVKQDHAVKYSPTALVFRHAAEHHHLYKAILASKQGSEILHGYVYKFTSNLAGKHIRHLLPKGKKPPVPQELIVHFMVSSLISILTWWLNHDMPCSPDEICEMYHCLVLPSINAGLGKIGH